MTDHHPQTSRQGGPPPTQRQQRYLRHLALERGISFVPPHTRGEASRLIDELMRRRREPRADRRREIRAVQEDMATGRGDAARVREDVELTGYGQRVLGVVRLVDVPAAGDGRRYVIERGVTRMTELEAIVADYLEQA